MFVLNFKSFFFATILAFSLGAALQAQESSEHSQHSKWDLDKLTDKESHSADHHALVHPFLTHMGMPDNPGELSTRIMSIDQRIDGSVSSTYGFHLETGIVDRLGLHLRNDAVKFHDSTELMLQYAVLRSDSGLSGISIIGEVEFPTGPTTNKTTGGAGASFAYVFLPVLALNSVIHYVPKEKMIEWEISLAGKLTNKIFPVIEANGEKMKNEKAITNFLAGLKFKIPDGHALGVAYQVGTTGIRDFDSRLLFQAELNFH